MLNFRNALIAIALTITLVIIVMFSNSVNADKPKIEGCNQITKPSAKALPAANKESDAFKLALKVVMEHEGGLSNDKADKGLITRYGISLRYIRSANIDIDGDGDSDADDILKLTQTDADRIYYRDFWTKYKLDRFINNRISTKLFDSIVNMGYYRTSALTKRALNKAIFGHISVDGVLDDRTVDIINNMESVLFLNAFRVEQAAFYEALIKRTPAFSVFRKGWLARANS